jgi:hypothetical protein
MQIIDTTNLDRDVEFMYLSLDTAEGKDCVGHWIWECSFFINDIKKYSEEYNLPIKILLSNKKAYKLNILSDFGFNESDIVYSNKMTNHSTDLNLNYVIPEEEEYVLIVPSFFYLWKTSRNSEIFFNKVAEFRKYYIDNLPAITKTIDITYISRSQKENYSGNNRKFINFKDFRSLMNEKNVNILDIDTLSSLKPQFHTVLSSKVIIVEAGSAFTINCAFIASNSHIIIINDIHHYNNPNNTEWLHMLLKLVESRNNTVEIFSRGDKTNNNTPFSVDLNRMSEKIDILRSLDNLDN